MRNRKSLIISTLVCLIPVIVSVMLYDQLPEKIAIHFDSTGAPDNYLPKDIVAWGLPVLFAVLNLYLHFRIVHDARVERSARSLRILTQWAVPLVSVIMIPVTLFLSIGKSIPIPMIATGLAGLIIIICGNYLPKCRRNFTIGIKLPWTLDSDENWNHTHRFAGWVWIAGGLFILINSVLQIKGIGLIVGSSLVILPIFYSYGYSRKAINGG